MERDAEPDRRDSAADASQDSTETLDGRAPGIPPTADSPDGAQAASSGTRSVQRIGPYKVRGVLGRGGMSVVYRAEHPSLERDVAVKVLLGGKHASKQRHERFLLEAQAVARLRHPNLVTVYDLGEEEECPYLVMELVEGEALSARASGRELMAPREAARICQKVAAALAYAHGESILHRDVKPANIILRPDGEPLLADFGLAKHLDSEHAGPTSSGQVLGTPAYMSPEQTHGGLLDARTDVYALGVTLYELLTGEVPFEGGTAVELIGQILTQEPDPPSQRREGPLDRDLETICLVCLRKEPQRRYASAAALADDLGRYLAGESVVARPTGVLEREWDALRQNRRASPITIAMTILPAEAE